MKSLLYSGVALILFSSTSAYALGEITTPQCNAKSHVELNDDSTSIGWTLDPKATMIGCIPRQEMKFSEASYSVKDNQNEGKLVGKFKQDGKANTYQVSSDVFVPDLSKDNKWNKSGKWSFVCASDNTNDCPVKSKILQTK